MHANSFGIFYERISPYGSIMYADFFSKSLILRCREGEGWPSAYHDYHD
jgi:hypothetical protein